MCQGFGTKLPKPFLVCERVVLPELGYIGEVVNGQ